MPTEERGPGTNPYRGSYNYRTHAFESDPPDIVIEAGYYMMRARRNWPDGYYLAKAMQKVEDAGAVLVKEFRIYEMQISEILYHLYEAGPAQVFIRSGAKIDSYRMEQGRHSIGRAHNAGRLLLKEMNFRPITNEDFLKFGAGGGR